jgi:hypothetical protein
MPNQTLFNNVYFAAQINSNEINLTLYVVINEDDISSGGGKVNGPLTTQSFGFPLVYPGQSRIQFKATASDSFWDDSKVKFKITCSSSSSSSQFFYNFQFIL